MTERKKPLPESLDEQLAATLAEALTPIAPPAERAGALKSRVMSRIRGKKAFDLLTIRSNEGTWTEILPGVEKKILQQSEDGKTQSSLLRMAPGSMIPAHTHDHDEESIMLEGDAHLGELHLSAGDYHFACKGSRHELVTTDIGCLLFLRIQA